MFGRSGPAAEGEDVAVGLLKVGEFSNRHEVDRCDHAASSGRIREVRRKRRVDGTGRSCELRLVAKWRQTCVDWLVGGRRVSGQERERKGTFIDEDSCLFFPHKGIFSTRRSVEKDVFASPFRSLLSSPLDCYSEMSFYGHKKQESSFGGGSWSLPPLPIQQTLMLHLNFALRGAQDAIKIQVAGEKLSIDKVRTEVLRVPLPLLRSQGVDPK